MAYPILLALLTGIALVIQPVGNSRLASLVGSTLWACGLSASMTAIVIFACAAFLSGAPNFNDIAGRNSWLTWTGGVLGAVSLIGLTYAVPRIGAAAVLVLVVAAQIVTALLVDRLWTPRGFSATFTGAGRVAGALLVLGGVAVFSLSSTR